MASTLTRGRRSDEGRHHDEGRPITKGYDDRVDHDQPEDAEAEAAVDVDPDDRKLSTDERNDRSPRCVDGGRESGQDRNGLHNRVTFFDFAHPPTNLSCPRPKLGGVTWPNKQNEAVARTCK